MKSRKSGSPQRILLDTIPSNESYDQNNSRLRMEKIYIPTVNSLDDGSVMSHETNNTTANVSSALDPSMLSNKDETSRPNTKVSVRLGKNVIIDVKQQTNNKSNRPQTFQQYAAAYQDQLAASLHDRLSIFDENAYNPRHLSSGALSVTESRYNTGTIEALGGKLWGDGVQDVNVREERLQLQAVVAAMAEKEEIRMRERDLVLRLKTLNTLFGRTLSVQEALDALRSGHAKINEVHADGDDTFEQDMLDITGLDQTGNATGTNRALHFLPKSTLDTVLDSANKLTEKVHANREKNERRQFLQEAREQRRAERQAKRLRDGFDLAFDEDEEDEEDDDEFQFDNHSQSSMTTLTTDNVRAAFTVQPSAVRTKLKTLAKFVSTHSLRKLLDNWNLIEGRIKNSAVMKTIMVTNSQGLSYPAKQQAIQLHSLTGLLCASKVKFNQSELSMLYSRLGFTREETNHSRKIAALQLTIASNNNSEKSRVVKEYRAEVQTLLQNKLSERQVTLAELMKDVFPEDEAERNEQLEIIRERRQGEVQRLIEEKRKKDEIKAKSEARRIKMMIDFENTLADIQLIKSQLSREKRIAFAELLEYCKQTIAELTDDLKTSLTPEKMSFLGYEMFPLAIQLRVLGRPFKPGDDPSQLKAFFVSRQSTASSKKSLDVPPLSELMDQPTVLSAEQAADDSTVHPTAQSPLKSKKPDALTKIRLCGPPSALSILREMVSFGRGLNGMAYRDVVTILQSLAATRAQSMVRCRARYWRYTAAKKLWMERDGKIKLQHYSAWSRLTLYLFSIRTHCWRKLKVWYQYTKRAAFRRETFRICYWPFRVWKKYSDREATAKEKAKFLVHRVMPTLCKLRIFRAWKKYSLQEAHFRIKALDFQGFFTRRAAEVSFFWLKEWSRKRRLIRKAWTRRGYSMMRTKQYYAQLVPFNLWRVYARYRRLMCSRVKTEFLTFRYHLLHDRAPMRLSSASEKRVRRTSELREQERLRIEEEERELMESRGSQRSKPGSRQGSRQSSRHSKSQHGSKHGKRKRHKDENGDADYSDSSDAGSEVSTSTTRALKLPDMFRWTLDVSGVFDIDDDNDDLQYCPTIVEQCHELTIAAVPDVRDLDVLHKPRKNVLEQATTLYQQFLHADRWVMFESAMRFHRFGRRAFNNLRSYARSKVQSRRFQKSRLLRVKSTTFNAIVENMMHGTRRHTVNFVSPADQVTNLMRGHHVAMVVQRRKVINDVKAVMGMDNDDSPSDLVLFKLARKVEEQKTAHEKLLADQEQKKLEAEAKRKQRAALNVDLTASPMARSRGSATGTLGTSRSTTGTARTGMLSRSSSKAPRDIMRQASSKVQLVRKISSNVKIDTLKESDSDDDSHSTSSVLTPNTASPPKRSASRSRGNKVSSKQFSRSKDDASLVPEFKAYVPPNMLQSDREARDREEMLTKMMVDVSREMREQAAYAVDLSDKASQDVQASLQRKVDMRLEVLSRETRHTDKAVTRQKDYSEAFKVHIADQMVSILAKIYEEVQRQLEKEETRVYFRALKMPMFLKRTKAMFHRKKLVNWIRICRRLQCISQNAAFYQSRRTMWVVFNRWLKFIEREQLNASPGWVHNIKRRCELHPDYSKALAQSGFKKLVYPNSDALSEYTSDYRSLFLRWKMLTQEEVVFRQLEEKVVRLRYYKTLRKVFYALKSDFSASENAAIIKKDVTNFNILRLETDIDQAVKRFMSIRRFGLMHVVAKFNKKFIHYMKKDGRNALSFKKFIGGFLADNHLRVNTEQRILSENFERRGTQLFTDIRVPEVPELKPSADVDSDDDDSVETVASSTIYNPLQIPIELPLIMQKLDGKRFVDPHERNTDGREITIPGGYRLHKIKFLLRNMGGICGWQLVWSADCMRDIESARRGNWNSAATNAQEFLIPKEDFVVGVEYMYDGPVIVAIRLKLFHKGFTSWIGAKNSMSTLSTYMGVEDVPRHKFEEERDSLLGDDEKHDPALPYTFVIGFTGTVYKDHVSSLGLVVRKVKNQSLFSYYWVRDAIAKEKAAMSERAALHSIMLDIDSVPSHVVTNQHAAEGNLAVKESLTTSQVELRTSTNGNATSKTHDADDDEDADDGDAFDENETMSGSSDGSLSGDEHAPDGRPLSREQSGRSEQLTTRKSISLPMISARSNASGTLVSSKKTGRKARALRRKLRKKQQTKKADGYNDEELPEQELSSAENQFFDLMRMRSIELARAVTRAEEFARRLWTDNKIRKDPTLSKLTCIKVVSKLAKWLFNGINRRLIATPKTEKAAVVMLKSSKQLKMKADSLRRRSEAEYYSAQVLEQSVQPWTGKSLLGPYERALKKEHTQKIVALRKEAKQFLKESVACAAKAEENERNGLNLFSRVQLSNYVYHNFRVKILAARQKEMLLQRMDVEQMKSGLFGVAKKTLMPADQMEAVHDSLRNRKIEMKSNDSLSLLVNDVINELTLHPNLEEKREREIAEQRRRTTLLGGAIDPNAQQGLQQLGRSSTVKSDLIGVSRNDHFQPRFSHTPQENVQRSHLLLTPLFEGDDDSNSQASHSAKLPPFRSGGIPTANRHSILSRSVNNVRLVRATLQGSRHGSTTSSNKRLLQPMRGGRVSSVKQNSLELLQDLSLSKTR